MNTNAYRELEIHIHKQTAMLAQTRLPVQINEYQYSFFFAPCVHVRVCGVISDVSH